MNIVAGKVTFDDPRGKMAQKKLAMALHQPKLVVYWRRSYTP